MSISAMKLSELRSYLTSKKLKFKEYPRPRHLHYLPIDPATNAIILPTILCISNRPGDAALGNLKGVADGLGLSLRELETSTACHIGRRCVLLRLAWHLLAWSHQRQQQMPDSENARNGVRAMVVSAGHLLNLVDAAQKEAWNREESRALNAIFAEVSSATKDAYIGESAKRILASIERTRDATPD